MSHPSGPVSIFDSLTQPLPQFDNTPSSDTPPRVDEGAISTRVMPPPKIAIPRRPDVRWHKLGKIDLDPTSIGFSASLAGQMASLKPSDKWAAESLAYAKAFRDKKYFVPEREDNITHSNEADVVRSAGLYLIHPVLQAISAHPRYYHQVISQAEDYGAKTRTDMTFYFPRSNGSAPDEKRRAFAVLEYKKREAFDPSNFDQGPRIKVPSAWGASAPGKIATILEPYEGDSAGQARHKIAVDTYKELVEACNLRTDTAGSTLFKGSEENLIKQAASYSITYRVRYVALFNWDCMVLCYFPYLDFSKTQSQLETEYRPRLSTRSNPGKPGKLYPVEVDIYTKDDENWRLALMSFLQHAWEETKKHVS